LGRAYTEFGDYSEAIEILNSASTLGGMETEIFWLRARSYYMQKDLENTVRDYDNAIGYMGENVQEELVEEYLNVLLEINQKLKAEEVVRNLAFNFSENAFVNMMAVKVNYKLEQNAKVDYYLRELEALELDKGIRKEYLEYKLLYLFDQNSFDMREVEKYMEELFEIDRFNPYYYYFLANVQKEKGEVELAGQSLERSIEYDVNYEITKRSKEILSSLR
jgi:tetratricopeptide (TPR) repeat protein